MNETQVELCELCGKVQAHHVHHIDLNHKNDKKENLQGLCTLCHSKIHGIEPRRSALKELVVIRDRALRAKNVLANQTRGFSRIEMQIPDYWVAQNKEWKKKIGEVDKAIKAKMKENGYPIQEWLLSIKGIDVVTAAKFISHIDIKKTPSVSALWRYCGLDATHVKRTKKISEKEAHFFGSPYLKKECMGILADSFVKQRTPVYRQIYDNEKARQTELHKTVGCDSCKKYKLSGKMHCHLRAKRKMVKIFLQHFWVKWREAEGLPVSAPYVEEKLGHTNIIKPAE